MIGIYLIHWRRERWILRYLNGTLSPKKHRTMELHLEKCSKCRELLAQEQEFAEEISSTRAIYNSYWKETRDYLLDLPRHSKEPQFVKSSTKERKSKFPFLDIRISPALTVPLLLLVLLSIFWFVQSVPKLTPMKVTQLAGDGIWKLSAGDNRWEKVGMNYELEPGDSIRTGGFGETSLDLGKGVKVLVSHSSRIIFFDDTSTALNLIKGQIYVELNRHQNLFQVKTPAGMVQAYGTQFQITVDSSQNTIVSCIQNTVFFGNSFSRVTIPSGFQSTASLNSPPSIPMNVDITKLVYWEIQFEKINNLSASERKQLHDDYINQGDQLFNQKQYDDALDTYRYAAYLDMNDYAPFYGIGRSYREKGDFAEATTTFLLSLQRKSDNEAIIYQLSLSLTELKQYDLAKKLLLHIISKQIKNPIAWTLLGNNYLLDNELDKAEKAYLEAIQLGGERSAEYAAQIHGGLAEIARRYADHKKAEVEIALAMKYDNLPGLVYAESARLYLDLGDRIKEKEAWQNYLKVDPYGGFADQARDRLGKLEDLK